MPLLSPKGVRILDANDNGVVSGHGAPMARLHSDNLVVPHQGDGGTHWMTEAGWTALEEQRQRNGATAPAISSSVMRKLPPKPHEAVLTAARRPDQLVAGRDDSIAHWAGETWFRTPTLRAVHAAGYGGTGRAGAPAGTVTHPLTRVSTRTVGAAK